MKIFAGALRGAVALSALFALAPSSTAQAAVHRVLNGQSLQNAINLAAVGDVIVADPVDYAEDITITKGITIVTSIDLDGHDTQFQTAPCGGATLCGLINIDSLAVLAVPAGEQVNFKSFYIARESRAAEAVRVEANVGNVWLERFGVGDEAVAPNSSTSLIPSMMIKNNPGNVFVSGASIFGAPAAMVAGSPAAPTRALSITSSSSVSAGPVTIFHSNIVGGAGTTISPAEPGAEAIEVDVSAQTATAEVYVEGAYILPGVTDPLLHPASQGYIASGPLTMYMKMNLLDPGQAQSPSTAEKTLLGLSGGFLADNVFEPGFNREMRFRRIYDAPGYSQDVDVYGFAWSFNILPGTTVASTQVTCPGDCTTVFPGTAITDLTAVSGTHTYPGLLPLFNFNPTYASLDETFSPNSVSAPLVLFGQGFFYNTVTQEETFGSPSLIVIVPNGTL